MTHPVSLTKVANWALVTWVGVDEERRYVDRVDGGLAVVRVALRERVAHQQPAAGHRHHPLGAAPGRGTTLATRSAAVDGTSVTAGAQHARWPSAALIAASSARAGHRPASPLPKMATPITSIRTDITVALLSVSQSRRRPAAACMRSRATR